MTPGARIFAAAVCAAVFPVAAAQPEIPKASKGEQCVAPLDEMRRDHITMLLHQRDRTMYQAERDARFSLIGCVDCHARTDDGGKFIAIDAPGEFCQVCHAFTSVTMDCFQCHATTPARTAATQ